MSSIFSGIGRFQRSQIRKIRVKFYSDTDKLSLNIFIMDRVVQSGIKITQGRLVRNLNSDMQVLIANQVGFLLCTI